MLLCAYNSFYIMVINISCEENLLSFQCSTATSGGTRSQQPPNVGGRESAQNINSGCFCLPSCDSASKYITFSADMEIWTFF